MSEQDQTQQHPADDALAVQPGPADSSEAAATPPSGGDAGLPASPGAMLREAREAAGIPLDVMAAQVRLNLMTLMAMESDDFVTLHEPVYVRGYYRKCAQVLGLSVEEVVAAYERTARPRAPALPAKLPVVPGGEMAASSGGSLRLLLGIVLLLAMAAAAAWWLLREPEPLTVSSLAVPPPMQQQALPAEPATGTALAEGGQASATGGAGDIAGADDQAGSSVAIDAAAADAAVAPGSAVPPAAAAVAPAQLHLELVDESWVRVVDANQRSLVNGLYSAGRVFELSGAPPFQVRLGNAPGVRLRYEGREVDLAAHTGRNRTAVLTLP